MSRTVGKTSRFETTRSIAVPGSTVPGQHTRNGTLVPDLLHAVARKPREVGDCWVEVPIVRRILSRYRRVRRVRRAEVDR
jgi:hypothetical protein